MTIKFVGETIPITRVMTGFHSFDRAFINYDGDIGFPIRTVAEVYGPNHVGKSTFWYTLAAIICKSLGGKIALLDLEGFDHKFLETVLTYAGYEGEINLISLDTDEDELKELADSLGKGYTVGILDSIGGIAPIGEIEGKLYEANMGRRGMLMARLSRRILHIQRKAWYDSKQSSIVLATNHQHLRMGGTYDMLSAGPVVTPGGETKNYLSSVRILMRRKEKFPDGSYTVHGKVTKNKWGICFQEFDMFCLSGRGFHLGLSAMLDCVNLKLAKRVSGGMVMIGKTKIAKLSTLVKKADDPEIFEPFFEALEENEK
jgi:RecA/RadA recombinase